MTVHSKAYLTPEEYLALERAAETKSEYLDGEMIAMTGASRPHNLIVTNVLAELRQQLKRRPCEVYPGEMRVWIPATGLYTYPDVGVVCGEPALVDDHFDMLTNPTVLIEVLSPSTEAYDRGRKFEHYRTLASLREYLLVSQDQPRIEQYVRQEDGSRWLFSAETGLGATLALPSIECHLALVEIYDKVSFPAPTPAAPAPAKTG
jgi:Uma2 family endonuclease